VARSSTSNFEPSVSTAGRIVLDALPRAQLGERARADRGDLRLLQQVQRQVEDVHAEIDQRATTGQLAVGEPAAHARDPVAPHPVRLGVVDPAELPLVDLVLQRRDVTALAVVEDDLEHLAGLLRRLDHRAALVDGAGQGLLAEHVQPLLQRGQRDRGVQLRRRTDADGVQAVGLQEVLPPLVEMRYPVLLAELGQGVLLQPGQRHYLDVRQLRERFECGPPGKAETDHSDP
jgi:hypothetical protein